MDDFEQFLQQQPRREVPRHWRRKILAAAPQRESWWRTWLWPAPAAWAALAGLWLVILGLNFAGHSTTQPIAQCTPVPAQEIKMALAEKRQWLKELTDPTPSPAQPQPMTGPHGALILNLPETRYV